MGTAHLLGYSLSKMLGMVSKGVFSGVGAFSDRSFAEPRVPIGTNAHFGSRVVMRRGRDGLSYQTGMDHVDHLKYNRSEQNIVQTKFYNAQTFVWFCCNNLGVFSTVPSNPGLRRLLSVPVCRPLVPPLSGPPGAGELRGHPLDDALGVGEGFHGRGWRG